MFTKFAPYSKLLTLTLSYLRGITRLSTLSLWRLPTDMIVMSLFPCILLFILQATLNNRIWFLVLSRTEPMSTEEAKQKSMTYRFNLCIYWTNTRPTIAINIRKIHWAFPLINCIVDVFLFGVSRAWFPGHGEPCLRSLFNMMRRYQIHVIFLCLNFDCF